MGKQEVNIACLPSTKERRSDECFATGWGTLKESGRQPNVLQEVQLPIVSREECNKAYGGRIQDGMICAGFKKGSKDSCQGDSGGPLVCRIDGDRFELRGITSFGRGCARAGKYGVYTETFKYNTWIEKKIVQNDISEAMKEIQSLQAVIDSSLE